MAIPEKLPGKPLSARNRPLWMLIPGGALMVLIIVLTFIRLESFFMNC